MHLLISMNDMLIVLSEWKYPYLLPTVSNRNYPRRGHQSVSPQQEWTKTTCKRHAQIVSQRVQGLTVDLPPLEATACAVNKNKTTKKARRPTRRMRTGRYVCQTVFTTERTTKAPWYNVTCAKVGSNQNVTAILMGYGPV